MLTSTVKNLGKYSVDLDEIWEGKKKQTGNLLFLGKQETCYISAQIKKTENCLITWTVY